MLKQVSLIAPEACLLDGRMAILDLETTGTSPARDRIIEVGLIRMSDGQVEDQWSIRRPTSPTSFRTVAASDNPQQPGDSLPVQAPKT